MTKKISGVFVPMVTPFKEKDESIDEDGLRQLTCYLVDNGIDGIIPTGSTGEFIAMTDSERKRAIEIVAEEANGRVEVYAGTGAYTTKSAVDLAKHAEKAGASGVMVITPYYMAPNEKELYQHYAAIREAISIPIMLYHNPYYSTVLLTDQFMAKLYNDGLINSVKERQADVFRQQNLRWLTDENFAIFYGYDICAIESFVMCADGWVVGTGNLFPVENKKVFDLVKAGKIEEAKDHWFKNIRPYLSLFLDPSDEGFPTPWLMIIKEGLKMRGINAGIARKPVLPLSETMKTKVAQMLKELGHL